MQVSSCGRDVPMFINDLSDATPRRRRIIQQPLRTERPIALIGGNGQTTELEPLLRRAHPLIPFPSLSHFLAEPPTREGWAAIVVARPSAWDAQLARYVRRRSEIALFALPEEGYGWPEEVSRLANTDEVNAWLEKLNAPEPVVVPKPAKRTPRAKPKAEPKGDLPSWLDQNAPVWEAVSSGSARVSESEPEPARSSAPPARRDPEQLELTGVAHAAPKGARKQKRANQARAKDNPRTAGHAKRAARAARTEAAGSAAPEGVSAAFVRSILAQKRPEDRRGDGAFLEAAGELGLLRAAELLEELRDRAAGLARRVSGQ